ncbi:Cysteine synthase A [Balamuthia mandrillaris]
MEGAAQKQQREAPPVCEGFSGAIGCTPLIRLRTISEATGCQILAKAEWMNPGGSVKDRAALYMINEAEQQDLLTPGGWIVEATAGNTGIGLVHIANERGYKCLFTCSASTSQEKVQVLQRLGAQTVCCPPVPPDDPEHFQQVGRRKAKEMNAFFTDQFNNLANMRAHYHTTGPEIWQQTQGKVDGVALAAGTGGTIAGTSHYLKDKNPDVQVYLMNLQSSGITADQVTPIDEDEDGEKKKGVLRWRLREKTKEEKEKNKPSNMEGIGSSLLYKNLAQAKIDGLFECVDDRAAVTMAHYLLHREGIYTGGSGALNVVAAYLLAKKMGPGHCIVTFLCDGGERYASKLYDGEWLKEKGLTVADPLPSDLSFLDEVERLNLHSS